MDETLQPKPDGLFATSKCQEKNIWGPTSIYNSLSLTFCRPIFNLGRHEGRLYYHKRTEISESEPKLWCRHRINVEQVEHRKQLQVYRLSPKMKIVMVKTKITTEYSLKNV